MGLLSSVSSPSAKQGLREGGSVGTSYPGRGLEGPEEWRLSRQVLNKIFFSALYPSLLFGQKVGPNLSEDLFFFALHLILGKKSDQISVNCKFSAQFWNFGGPASISVPPGKLSLWGPAAKCSNPDIFNARSVTCLRFCVSPFFSNRFWILVSEWWRAINLQ